ncbi:methionyl-tRNA formyltransferase [Marinoscillum furvescens]|uniref:Methionyl-tRNA formyltransferase n=1 Tax=Marinoscillum furvescens DSM 4134 TaxID=1122208 RepID=A0A3D9L6D8_MARFU|nr:formyltransferase family protein [Marinoscillum furvescens]REE01718.1 methionyl-tRNA formyltransferase [Marinoscillum furvescens DSM 4134]
MRFNKVSFLTCVGLSAPIVKTLYANDLLDKLLIEENYDYIKPAFNFIPDHKIRLIRKDSEFPIDKNCKLVFALSYPHKLPKTDIPILNIHFGALPENRGPDPVFWTIRNNQELCFVTIHEIAPVFDTGAVVIKRSFQVRPEETYGGMYSRLVYLTIPMIEELMKHGFKSTTAQNENDAITNKLPKEPDLTIDWKTMSSSEINCLVRACNPKYGGAITTLNGVVLRILEISPININMKPGEIPKPGMIVHSSNAHGIAVACADGLFIKLNIASVTEGFLTGNTLSNMGVQTGTILGQ